MELTMPKDYLQTLLDRMNKQSDDLSGEISKLRDEVSENTKTTNQILDQAKYTNGKVMDLQKRTKALEKTRGRRLNIDPKTVYILAIALMLLLAIIASKLNINLQGIL